MSPEAAPRVDLTPDGLPVLIGLTGYKDVGKDSFARALAPMGYGHISFARALKITAARLYGVPLGALHDREMKERVIASSFVGAPEITGRELLVGVGMALRGFDSEIWIRAAMNSLIVRRRRTRPVVITDVRMANEGDAIREAGGVLVRVRRASQEVGTGEVWDVDHSAFDVDAEFGPDAPDPSDQEAFGEAVREFVDRYPWRDL